MTRKKIALGLRKMTPVLLSAGSDCTLEMMDAQDQAVRILEGKNRIYALSETNLKGWIFRTITEVQYMRE